MFADWERDLIVRSRVGRLATIAYDGRPHLVPVCYAFHEGRFFVAVDEKPKRGGELARVRDIKRDPRVTLLMDHYADDWEQLAWVRIDGLAAVFPRGEVEPEGLAALRARYPQYEAMALEGLPLIVVGPERHVSWRASDGTG
jgi:PPOX class probable F420-dependent enzyme